MINIEKYPLVICKWRDTVATDSNWRSEDDAIDWVDSECGTAFQTGFMLEKNDEYLILLDSFFERGDTVGTVTRIPIETVVFIKIIPIKQLIE